MAKDCLGFVRYNVVFDFQQGNTAHQLWHLTSAVAYKVSFKSNSVVWILQVAMAISSFLLIQRQLKGTALGTHDCGDNGEGVL